MTESEYREGDLRVFYIPQIPMPAYEVGVPDMKTGALVLDALVNHDPPNNARDVVSLITFLALLITVMVLPFVIDSSQPAPIPSNYSLPTLPER